MENINKELLDAVTDAYAGGRWHEDKVFRVQKRFSLHWGLLGDLMEKTMQDYQPPKPLDPRKQHGGYKLHISDLTRLCNWSEQGLLGVNPGGVSGHKCCWSCKWLVEPGVILLAQSVTWSEYPDCRIPPEYITWEINDAKARGDWIQDNLIISRNQYPLFLAPWAKPMTPEQVNGVEPRPGYKAPDWWDPELYKVEPEEPVSEIVLEEGQSLDDYLAGKL